MKIYQVDSFTNEKFRGNPAGVCILDKHQDTQWMQNIAVEMNLSETAFVLPDTDHFRLRWFTPKIEVDICGHATLASAHILYTTGMVPADQMVRFQTRSGLLTVEHNDGWLEMDFPSDPERQVEVPPILVQALGGPVVEYAGRSRLFYLLRLENEQEVRSLQPDFNMLSEIPDSEVIVTAPSSSPEFDFVSRFFAPGVGINEDPVTGSAHCTLGPYWQKVLGKNDFTAYQASRRGGVVKVRVREERTRLVGQAVTVFHGKLD